MTRRIRVIDSHTEGEPTRVVVEGGPDLGPGSASERAERFRRDHDDFRHALVGEPRGFEAMVGALLMPPSSSDAVAQVLFFNNVGTLHMCVHGMLGVGRTLAALGRIDRGRHRVQTPVGDVFVTLDHGGRVTVDNVPSRRALQGLRVSTRAHGTVVGDVAWGGNWFFLAHEHDQRVESSRIPELTAFCWDVRRSLEREGVTGDDGREIDHIEVFGPPQRADADSKNFVLCPGGEYDRSPCGTGTSAKLACLFADGRITEGQTWRQESIIGSRFTGHVRVSEDGVVPTITGGVWITAETTLVIEPDDPYGAGIRR